MMRAVVFALLFLFRDAAIETDTIRLHSNVGSSRGVIGQPEQPAGYRVSKVIVKGANAFTPGQIIRFSTLKSGQVVGEQTIAKAREAVGRAYANLGFIKAIVRVEPDFKPALPEGRQGAVDVRIEIEEGAVFDLRRLEFFGNKTTRDRIVRRRVLQQEGEPYNQELMEKSVKRINGLGRFEKLTMANVEIRVDEQEHFVDLLVRLKEIRRSHTRR